MSKSVKSNIDFKSKFSFDDRKSEADRVMANYRERIPIIVNIDDDSDIILSKFKYLVPKDLTCSQFLHVVRKRIELTPEQALYMFVGNSIPPGSSLMSQLYNDYKDPDNFLYFNIRKEATFG